VIPDPRQFLVASLPKQLSLHKRRLTTVLIMKRMLSKAISDDRGQDIAEYAVMAAVTIMIVAGILMLIGVRASEVFFHVGNALR
jgi:Flp pilus assembly pilin Flp